jgi:hypothetical protein
MRGVLSRPAIFTALAFGAADILVVFTRTGWIGFLGYTPEWANAGLYVASPLVAGAAAFLCRGYFTPEVVAITGGPRLASATRAAVVAWLRVLTLALVTHLVVMLIALAVTIAFGASGTLGWEPFGYAFAPLAMACAIGIALSAAFPHVWAAVLAVLVTYAVWYLSATTESLVPVNVGGATISLAGLSYRSEALVASATAAFAVTAAFLTIAVAAIRLRSFAVGVTVFTFTTVFVVIAGSALGAHFPIERFEASEPGPFACAGAAPRVCLTSAHRARLEEIAREVESAGRLLTDAGVDLSGVVLREDVADGRPDADGVLLLPFGRLNGIDVGRGEYAHSLLRPTDCVEYYVPQPTLELERLFDAAEAVGEWIDARVRGAMPRLSEDQVRDLYEGLQACSVPARSLEGILGS